MNRVLVIVIVGGIVCGCANSGAAASPGAATSAAATDNAASAQPSAAATPFPTGAFAGLGENPVPADRAARLQAALERTAPGGGIGATVMTPEGTWSGASGTEDGVREVAIHTQFGIASVTKPIVAAQVMRMVEAGELSLDAPAASYLAPDLGFDTNGATVRQLLSHRSGLPDWYGGANEERLIEERDRAWTQEEVLGLVDPARGPRDTFEYADTNYNVLGLVIEHVRKRPLADVLREGALRVDGTERLIYQPAEAPTEPMAMPRGEPREAMTLGGGYLPSLADASADGPAGSGASDTPSLARWWRAFCAGEVVSRASLNEMASFYENGEIDYGLGLFDPLYKNGYAPAVGHLGASFGYKASAGCLPEDGVVFAVLTNATAIDSQDLAMPLLRAALSD